MQANASSEAKAHAHHQILIVGGDAAGITVAATLKRRDPDLDIAIVDPAARRYLPNQPCRSSAPARRRRSCISRPIISVRLA